MPESLRAKITACLPVSDKAAMIANANANWPFALSATAFFCINSVLEDSWFGFSWLVSFMVTVIINILMTSQVPPLINILKKTPAAVRVMALVSSVGACSETRLSFLSMYADVSPRLIIIKNIGPVSIALAILAFPYVYAFMAIFYERLGSLLKASGLLKLKIAEKALYAGMIIFFVTAIFIIFARTDAFYGACPYDVIYTTDSATIMAHNAYVYIYHAENDLRQPLFAFLSMPFVAPFCLVAQIINAPAHMQAALINIPQVCMILFSYLALAKAMRLSSRKRMLFMALAASTYPVILFSFNIEQYAIVCFWLALGVYCACARRQSCQDNLVRYAVPGTLLPGAALHVLASEPRNFKNCFREAISYGLRFIIILLVFGRFDVMLNMLPYLISYVKFTGERITMIDKLRQYLNFIQGCFAAPRACTRISEDTFSPPHISWQMAMPMRANIAGVIILALAAISAIISRKDKIARVSAYWIIISIVILLILGWGTRENGLILYTLYFGWAYLILLFRLAERLFKKALPIAIITAILILLSINIPSMLEMIGFAETCYPV